MRRLQTSGGSGGIEDSPGAILNFERGPAMIDPALDAASDQIKSAETVIPMVQAFFDEATFTASYVVWDAGTKRAAIIDSVLDYDHASGRTATVAADRIVAYVTDNGLRVDWLLETHVHADHLSAAPYLKGRLGGRIAIGHSITSVQRVFGTLFHIDADLARDGSAFDRLFEDGDRFDIGDLKAIVLHVPGHTAVDLAYVIGNAAFVGDTIFMPDYGTARADFPGGNPRTLYRSIRRLLTLPEQTLLFLCHDYKTPPRETFTWQTTVADQRRRNVHVRDGVDEPSFVAMRTARDAVLGMPRLFLPSIQVNMHAGYLPAPEGNGIRYLKIPVDAL
jgi:glyoxylase-like metal-dependent hydrolase (beta-lactamase superfamily II)